jgi:hypothetical protein
VPKFEALRAQGPFEIDGVCDYGGVAERFRVEEPADASLLEAALEVEAHELNRVGDLSGRESVEATQFEGTQKPSKGSCKEGIEGCAFLLEQTKNCQRIRGFRTSQKRCD